jgi:NAD dependent epimerase/dehydratase family enzyme
VHGEYFRNEKKPIFTKYTKAQKSKIQLARIDSAQRIENAKNKRSEELLIIQETKASYLETIKEILPEYFSIMDEHYCGP